MTEAEQRREESPLLSDRGTTTIKETVVSRIAGMAAQEVEGVRRGGNASRSAGGLLGGITGSDNSTTRGVKVEVGSVEAAIDLTMGIDYGKNILGSVGEVRQKISERVQEMTGLKVTELNVTISDITSPEDGQEDEGSGPSQSRSASTTGPDFDTRTMRRREPSVDDPETTEVEPRSRSYTEGQSGPVPEEEVRAEGTPVEEDETRRLRIGDEEPSGAESSETETSDAEAGATRGETFETSTPEAGTTRSEETERSASSEASDAPHAEAPTDETTLTGETDDRTREIERDQAAAAEERRERRRRRREEREDN